MALQAIALPLCQCDHTHKKNNYSKKNIHKKGKNWYETSEARNRDFIPFNSFFLSPYF